MNLLSPWFLLGVGLWRCVEGPLAHARGADGSEHGESFPVRLTAQLRWAKLIVDVAGGENDQMPTVARKGPYRFFFYSNEGQEPPHIHVQEGRKLAKFWLGPVALASSKHFAAHELRSLHRMVVEERAGFVEAWHGYFDSSD